MKRFIRKVAVVSFGVVSISALLAGSRALLVAAVDGFYYREIHSKMIDCSGFVRNHIEENARYPTTEMMKGWSQENDISPELILGAQGAGSSFPVLDGKLHNSELENFRIGYSTGDRYEFFNSWDASFTTSIRQHSGRAFCYGISLLAIGFVSYRMRKHLAET